jgi:hypothetical protein
MKKGGTGGAYTSRQGSTFEILTDEKLLKEMTNSGYVEKDVHRLSGAHGPIHGRTMQSASGDTVEFFYKTGLYRIFFATHGIDYHEYFSARLEPDTAIYSHSTKVLTIVEKKQMTVGGSVAEKLQTCDYKRHYYETLTRDLGIEVDIKWLLGEYFKQQQVQLKSVYEYMLSKGSNYYFDLIKLQDLRI